MKQKIMAFAAGALVLGTIGAHAQSAETTSLVDHNRTAVLAGPGTAESPGTVGAMNAVVNGVATSAEDVRRQQQGWGTISTGSRRQADYHASAAAGQSPGTVGAMPGN